MVVRNSRLRRDRNRGSWFFCFLARGKSFDVSKQILPIVTAQRQPGRHVTAAQSTLHGADYVRVERQGSGGCGAAFELRERKVARLGIDAGKVFTNVIPLQPMDSDAIEFVQPLNRSILWCMVIHEDRIAAGQTGILRSSPAW